MSVGRPSQSGSSCRARKFFGAFAAGAAVALGSLGLVGCGGGPQVVAPATGQHEAPARAIDISDEGFAAAVQALLLSPRGAERASRLAGVEARQMARALARFHAHAPDRGLAAVVGGLYLVRVGELDPGTLGPKGREALTNAAKDLSARGDEGRARALYELLVRMVPADERSEINVHLDALAGWTKDQGLGGPAVVKAGEYEGAAVARRLLEPSQAALDEATRATTDWIARAVTLRTEFRARRAQPSREEAGEAFRALQSGGTVLVALHLRDGDAAGALHALDRAGARELARPELVHALELVADKPDAARWLEVLHALTTSPHDGQDEEALDDHELLRAATFGVAMEAYRLDPTQPEPAAVVAAVLQELGMAEASPAVIAQATAAHPESRIVSGALAIALRAMASEVDADDADSARRAFAASKPLLAIADRKDLAGKLDPSAARVRAMMGEIELREGRLDAARELLTASSTEEKSGAVLLSLARIDRHDGKSVAAFDDLREALAAPDAGHDSALRGEILLMISDLTREKGDITAARTPLNDALKDLARARNTPDADDRARVERVLSRVLDRFGAAQRAEQALERAFEATPHDKRQIAATLGQLVARAYVRGDLAAARDGLSRALAAELDGDDLVYYALWVRLLERQLHATTDGVPGRVFSSILDDGRWAGRLAAFGSGRIKAEDLAGSAKTPVQKTEALFYAAMDRRVSGDAKGSDDALKQVIAGGGVDLMEVGIARDLLSGPRSQLGGPLPSDVALP